MRLFLYSLIILLAACSSAPLAPEFPSDWSRLINKKRAVDAIAFNPARTYRALPMDYTLEEMLRRIKTENNMELDYNHPLDFVLQPNVFAIKTTSLLDFIQALNQVYLPQGVQIQLNSDNGVITVTPSP